MLRYRLIVLTHGKSTTLERTLDSFYEMADPLPSDLICVRDGEGMLPPSTWGSWRGLVLSPQVGFCKATRQAWALACAEGDVTHVFWLEHDFIFHQPLPFVRMAEVLDENERLAQIAFPRNPVNEKERQAGSLLDYIRHRTKVSYHQDWLEHDLYFTTNPSLMRISFMRMHPWPDEEEACEGKFGIFLRESGYTFGLWGKGETWCEHIGTRTGFGY